MSHKIVLFGKRCFKTNIITIMSSNKTAYLTLNSSSKLVLKNEDGKERVLISEAVTSFDACCFEGEVIHIFLTTSGGSLLYLKYTEKDTQVKPVMLGKDSKNKICFVRTLNINGNFHLFYCLDSQKRYLVHQVLSGDSVYEPKVVDIIGKRFIYDVVADDCMNIHIIYSSDGGELKYKKYINSQKLYTEPKKICVCNPRFLCVCYTKDRLFASYTEQTNGAYNVYLLSVLDFNVKKAVFSVGSSTELALNSKGEELILHLVDNGVCYEIKSDLELNISKGTPLGKSSGICDVRSFDSESCVSRYPVSRDNTLFSAYKDFNPAKTLSHEIPSLKGRDAEVFAQKYKDMFDEKIAELQNEEFFQSLAKIDLSLKKLLEITQKIYEEIKRTDNETQN